MPQMENGFGLVIGVGAYHSIGSLGDAVREDATVIRDTLVDGAACAYPEANVRLLLDENSTKAAILAALADIAEKTDPESVVFVYFSGHGAHIADDAHAGEYLLPHEADAETSRGLAKSSISSEELAGALAELGAGRVTLVLDACHAGGIGMLKKHIGPVVKTGWRDQALERLAVGRGRAVIASSQGGETSVILADAAMSLFTTHLVAGLRGGAESPDGMVRLFQLFEYVQPRVTADNPRQHPVFKADLTNNYPVALAPGGQPNTIEKAPGEYQFEAYINMHDGLAERRFLWDVLVPRLQEGGVSFAVSGEVEGPGVPMIVDLERGMAASKRMIVLLSPGLASDPAAEFRRHVAQSIGIKEATYRLLPIEIADLANSPALPPSLDFLTKLNLWDAESSKRDFDRLITALKSPLPER